MVKIKRIPSYTSYKLKFNYHGSPRDNFLAQRRLAMWHVLYTIKNMHLNLALATVNKMAVRFLQRRLVEWIESSVVVMCDFVHFSCGIDVEGHKMFYKHIWSP